MRVALVNRFFHRAGAVPTVVREWAHHLEAAGHSVAVFAGDVDAAASTPARAYVPVRLGRWRAFDEGGLAFAWRLRRALSGFHSQSRLDVLLCTDSTAFFGASPACHRLGVPAVMAFQGWVYSPGKRGLYPRTVMWVYQYAVHFCARHAPRIACISREIYEGLSALGVPPERLWRAPNCIDLAAWDTGKRGAHRRAERQLLYVGRFSPEKGLRFLLEALPHVVGRFPRVRARLVGGEEGEGGEFHGLARRLGVAGHIEFAGHVPREALPGIYAEADLLVAPSLAEGHPLAPVEALASGTPVVGSDIPGLNETVADGVNGALVPPRDPAALAEAICRVLGDQALLDRLSRAAQPSVERYAWPRRIAEFEALIAGGAARE